MTEGVTTGLAIRRPDHLDVVDRGEVSQLYQDDGQVVDEQQGVYQGESELDDVGISSYLAAVLQQVNTVEQPEGYDEDEDEERDESAEDKYSGQCRLGPSEEETPGANQEDEELESKADQHSITGNITL